MQPGSCTKSIGHLALPESSHRELYVLGESEATYKGKVTGGGGGEGRQEGPGRLQLLKNGVAGLNPGIV